MDDAARGIVAGMTQTPVTQDQTTSASTGVANPRRTRL
jgi:hypothetical protein